MNHNQMYSKLSSAQLQLSSAAQRRAVPCGALPCGAVLCRAAPCCAVLSYIQPQYQVSFYLVDWFLPTRFFSSFLLYSVLCGAVPCCAACYVLRTLSYMTSKLEESYRYRGTPVGLYVPHCSITKNALPAQLSSAQLNLSSTAQCRAVPCPALPCPAVRCGAVLCRAAPCCAVLSFSRTV